MLSIRVVSSPHAWPTQLRMHRVEVQLRRAEEWARRGASGRGTKNKAGGRVDFLEGSRGPILGKCGELITFGTSILDGVNEILRYFQLVTSGISA